MSNKSRKRTRAASVRRLQGTAARVDTSYAVTPPGEYLASLPEAKRRNFIELAALLDQTPDVANELASMSDDEMVGSVVALAYPDLVGNPDQETRLMVAGHIRLWHMLHQLDSPVEHWPDINGMTDQEILDQIDADREAGPDPPAYLTRVTTAC